MCVTVSTKEDRLIEVWGYLQYSEEIYSIIEKKMDRPIKHSLSPDSN